MQRSQLNRYGIITARLTIDLVRVTAEAYLSKEFPSSSADLVMLCNALYIGHSDGRPMSAGKLASYIGMPRPTVIRKLQRLKTLGIAKQTTKGWWINDPNIDERLGAVVKEKIRLVRLATTELSKVDTAAIARRTPLV